MPAAPDAPIEPTSAPDATANPDDRAAELEARLADLQAQLDAARKQAADAEQARELQRLLVQARAIDLDAATLLARRDIGDDPAPDLAAVVRNLRRRKPHLFRPAALPTSMSPRANPAAAGDDPDALAELAASTGDRRALLRYLRARRR